MQKLGFIEDVQWSDYVIHSINREPGPSYTLNYDPEVLGAFKPENLWDKYDRIECPVLVIRGEKSTVLDYETAKRMTERGPMATLINVENCGHAPSLMTNHQAQLIKNWLRETEQLDEESEN